VGRLKALLASQNAHKLEELRTALPGWELELLEANYPPESGDSYYANALAKARFGRSIAGDEWMLGEDSGIEAAALGGRPGIESARWATDGVAALLAELDGVEDRRARYVCELVAAAPSGEELRGTGILEGAIAHEPRGSEGFGYDPIFIPEGHTQTVAQLGNAWKARNSHRARAAGALAEAFRAVGLSPKGTVPRV
jgi:XTP/dITP diphosphohydrolase